MKIIIMGPQGSGKGTQADLISEELKIPKISTGDLFRENIKHKTDLGKEAQSYMDRGNLVPDEITNGMVEERLKKSDCQKGFIFDGYPRNVAQAEFFLKLTDIDLAIDIELSDDEAISRISGRLVCH